MVESQKSVFDHVVYDSDVELEFATAFERSDDIKLYAKLPAWFKIDTPLGTYNPDWAVLIEVDGKKSSTLLLRPKVPYSPMRYDPLKKPKSHVAGSTSKLWEKRLSSPSQMRSRTFQGSTFNVKGG